MERKVYISRLLDFYGDTLPEKQRACMFQYYNDDLSLAEVSENLGITRQGVRDFIKRGEAVLEKTESELKIWEKSDLARRRLDLLSDELKEIADDVDGEAAERLKALADKIITWDVY